MVAMLKAKLCERLKLEKKGNPTGWLVSAQQMIQSAVASTLFIYGQNKAQHFG